MCHPQSLSTDANIRNRTHEVNAYVWHVREILLRICVSLPTLYICAMYSAGYGIDAEVIALITAFEVGNQRYERIGFYYVETKRSRQRMKLDVFQAPCADCGQQFAIGVKRTFNPNKRLHRRCKACRTYRGRKVGQPISAMNDYNLYRPVTIPLTRRKSLRNGDALMEPHAAPLGQAARSIDRRPAAPPEQGLMSDG